MKRWQEILPEIGKKLLYLAIASVLLLSFQGVILGGDDVLYARLAKDMSLGSPSFFINTHTCRLGFIVPMALLYNLFGIHDWVTLILPVLSSIGIILLSAYCAYRLYGTAASYMAALFSAFNPMLYRLGTIGLSDIQAAFLYGAFVTGWLLLAAGKLNRLRVWGAVTGICYAWALVTRPSLSPIMLIVLALFIYFCREKIVKEHFPVVWFFAGCLAVGVPYLIYLWIYTGNPFYFIEALIGGYHVPDAPWLPELHGMHYWMRLAGVTIILAAIEGYLLALFPVVVLALFLRCSPYWNSEEREHDYLLVAIIVPLLVLSHFSTSLTHWEPTLLLDLRLGFPLILPAAVLAAGVCVHLAGKPVSSRVTKGIFAGIVCFSALFFAAWYKGNTSMMLGACAAAFVSAALLFGKKKPWLVAATLMIFLIAAWGQFRTGEYKEIINKNTQLRGDAVFVPWKHSLPIMTDPLTAQYLPYLHGFTNTVRVVSWNGAKGKLLRSPWVAHINAPLPKPYLIVWYPKQARVQAERWNSHVPSWVISELKHAKLLKKLDGNQNKDNNTFPAMLGAGVYMVIAHVR